LKINGCKFFEKYAKLADRQTNCGQNSLFKKMLKKNIEKERSNKDSMIDEY